MQVADQAVDSELSNSGIEVHAMNTSLLHEPGDVRIAMGGRWVGHYGTLSPFLRSVIVPVNDQCKAVYNNSRAEYCSLSQGLLVCAAGCLN